MNHHQPYIPLTSRDSDAKWCSRVERINWLLLLRSLISLIHSFIQLISIAPFKVPYSSEALPKIARILCQSFMPKRHRQFAQCPYVAAIAGFEPATLRTKGLESTSAPQRPTLVPGSYSLLLQSRNVTSKANFAQRFRSAVVEGTQHSASRRVGLLFLQEQTVFFSVSAAIAADASNIVNCWMMMAA